MNSAILLFAAVAYAAMSAVTLAAFAWDKRAAARAAPRVPERRLHVLEALGGWPGALLAIRWLRHKNRKPGFWLITASIAAAHAAAWLLAWRAGWLAA